MPGVIGSRIGHQEGNEIVEVDYDPEQVTLAEMVRALKQESSFYSVVARDRDSYEASREQVPDAAVMRAYGKPQFIEPKHSLRTRYPDLYYLDLSEKQAVALNAWSYFGGAMPEVLTADQILLRARLHEQIRAMGLPPLRPLREGEGKKRYREALLQWLQSP